jgi:hypothetical protein
MSNEQKPIWYLPGPNFQYVEDVKALAREAGLRIIDANTTADRSNAAENPPEVTLKPVAAAASADGYVPTKAELMAAHERLMQMREELDAERERLHAQAVEQDRTLAEIAASRAVVDVEQVPDATQDDPPASQASETTEPKAPRAARTKQSGSTQG